MPDLSQRETSTERDCVEEGIRLAKHVMTMLNALRAAPGHQQRRLDRAREFQADAINALEDALELLDLEDGDA